MADHWVVLISEELEVPSLWVWRDKEVSWDK